MGNINIIQKPADPHNYGGARLPNRIQLVVIHVESGSEIGTIGWFSSQQAHVSAHYSISKAGQIYQHVPEAQIAWHAGIPAPYVWADNAKNQWPGVNPNAYSIGIEHEGYDDGQPWPDAQVHASAALVAWICARYTIPIDRAHVVGHHEIYSGHSCPGAACPVDGIVDLATASTSVAARRW